MIEALINKEDLDLFLKNLKKEDKMEFNQVFSNRELDEFYNYCLDRTNETYFLKSKDNLPYALGGVYKYKKHNKEIGKVWLILTTYSDKEKISIFKYVKNKIRLFKDNFDILFNFIYKSNFNALFWLKKCGFKTLKIDNSDYQIFYFNKGENNCDIRYYAS